LVSEVGSVLSNGGIFLGVLLSDWICFSIVCNFFFNLVQLSLSGSSSLTIKESKTDFLFGEEGYVILKAGECSSRSLKFGL